MNRLGPLTMLISSNTTEVEDMKKSTPAGKRDPKRRPTHPGAVLRETVLPTLCMSVSGAAHAMRVSRQTLHRILSEKGPVTPDMALRLGRFCGNGPELWLAIQQARDLWDAQQAIGTEIEEIPTQEAA
jgi:addiction module HigA family antidote